MSYILGQISNKSLINETLRHPASPFTGALAGHFPPAVAAAPAGSAVEGSDEE
jgi:hypothetical protein